MPFLSKNSGMFHVENPNFLLRLCFLALIFLSPVFNHPATAAGDDNKTFEQALEALEKGDQSTATHLFLSVLKTTPDHAAAFYHLGVISLSQGQLDQALKYLKESARIQPESLPVFLRLAETYEQRGNKEEALKALEAAFIQVEDNSSLNGTAVSKGISRLKAQIAVQTEIQTSMTLLREGRAPEAKAILQNLLLSETENEAVHHLLGISFGIEGRFDEAIKHLKAALKLKPMLSDASNRLTDLYVAQGQLEQARDTLERALFFLEDQEGLSAQSLLQRLDTVDDQIVSKALLDQAMQETKDKKIDAALATLKALIRVDPKHSIAYYNLGILSAQEKKFEQAIPFFEKAISVNPRYREAHERLAQIYELTRFYSRATAHYEQALNSLSDPESPSGKSLKDAISLSRKARTQAVRSADESVQQGKDALAQGQLDLAIQHYEQASLLNREKAEIRFELGLLYERKERPDLAIGAMQATLELSPTHLKAQGHLAKQAEVGGFMYQALKKRQAISRSEHRRQSGTNQQDILRLEAKIRDIETQTAPLITQASVDADPRSAIETLKVARALAPDDPRIRVALARLHLQAGSPIEAFKELSTAALFEPELARHQLELAMIYEGSGEWSNAEARFRKALEAKIDSASLKVEAERGLQRMLRKQKDIQIATRFLQRAHRYNEKQDYRTAIAWYEKVFRLFPTHSGALYWAGRAYENLGDYKNAKTLYQKVLQIDPNHLPTHEQLGHISAQNGEIETAIRHYRTNLRLWKGQENEDTIRVREHLLPLEKRLNVSLSQVLLSYDSNPSLSSDPRPQLRSGAGLSLNYMLKKDRRLTIPVRISSDTIFFFESNSLFSQQSLAISAAATRRPFSYSVGYNFLFGIARGGSTGFNHVGTLELNWVPGPSYFTALELSFDNFVSAANKDFNSKRSNLSLRALKEHGGKRRTSVELDYVNYDAVLNDQASISQGLTLSYGLPLSEQIYGSLDLGLRLTRFSNIDSLAEKRRKNFSQRLTLSAFYQLGKGLRLYASFMENRNNSNLSAGAVTIEQQLSGQASSLGDYRQRLISVNILWSF